MKFFIAASIALLTSCQGNLNKSIAEQRGFARVCVDKVQYLQFPSGATVAYSPEGKVKTCD